MSTEAIAPRPASTILLLRDSAASEIEVFMMVRHYQLGRAGVSRRQC
jgi:hypothetical protein